ncbi:MAG: hypothetical protein GY794_10480 [bacterium]|nr:hypothetical protein [bacterium]
MANKTLTCNCSLTHPRRIVATIILVCGICSPAAAHHIRGTPHYMYSENYPNAPKVEYVREIDNVTLRMTYYEIPGTGKVDLAMYVKDNRTGKNFEGEVMYAVYGEDENPLEAHTVKAVKNKNNIYKAGWEYEDKGLYFARVTFDCDGQKVDEIFKMQIGATEVNYWLLGLVGGGVLALIVAVAVIKKLQTNNSNSGEGSEQ